MFNLNYVIA
jgi:hypothetical protein